MFYRFGVSLAERKRAEITEITPLKTDFSQHTVLACDNRSPCNVTVTVLRSGLWRKGVQRSFKSPGETTTSWEASPREDRREKRQHPRPGSGRKARQHGGVGLPASASGGLSLSAAS